MCAWMQQEPQEAVRTLSEPQEVLQDLSDERLQDAVAAGLQQARDKASTQITKVPSGSTNGSLPAPDSLEASETSAHEETYV